MPITVLRLHEGFLMHDARHSQQAPTGMKDAQLGSLKRQSRVPLDHLLLRNLKGVDGSGSHHELRMINQLATQVC